MEEEEDGRTLPTHIQMGMRVALASQQQRRSHPEADFSHPFSIVEAVESEGQRDLLSGKLQPNFLPWHRATLPEYDDPLKKIRIE